MVALAKLFGQIVPKNVLVVGDFMLDRYTFGKTSRISPEAPVPVVSVEREEERAGGAGNVALNLISLGMKAHILGRVGDDVAGKALFTSLGKEKIDTSWLVTEEGYQTPQKVRLIASSQQVVRIDYERMQPVGRALEEKLLSSLPEIIKDMQCVAISDYGKGFLSKTLLRAIIDTANSFQIPVIADPKGVDFTKYSRATILKPNLSEARAAAPFAVTLEEAARHILKETSVGVLMVTRSEAGISLFYPDEKREDYPVQPREVKDVTGAGDTVLAMLASACANGISIGLATQLANIAAQVAVEKIGCALVSLSDIARKMIDLQAHSKIFDDEHLPALKEALLGTNVSFVHLAPDSTINSALFSSIRAAAAKSRDVVVTLPSLAPDEELVAALASLHNVSYLVLTRHEPEELLSLLDK